MNAEQDEMPEKMSRGRSSILKTVWWLVIQFVMKNENSLLFFT